MSPTQKRALGPGDAIAAFALVGIIAVIAFMFFGSSERPVATSAMGLKGLERSLRAQGTEIQYAGFQEVEPGSVGLRVLPILDTDLREDFERPPEDEDYLRTGTERDLNPTLVRTKIDRLPSLLIAPKWTRAVRHSGYAYESLLLPEEQAGMALAQLRLIEGPMIRPGGPLLEFRHAGFDGILYEPQLFSRSLRPGCEPVISPPDGHLLVRCERGSQMPVYLLSDPDLLNTHGLGRGQNAAMANAILTEIAGDKPILIDTTNYIFTFEQSLPPPAREWADLLRFFAYPFSIAWIGLGVLTALLLWRASIRFGPAQRIFFDRLGAARSTSIAAKAQLLRMAGNDSRLFQTHIHNRVRQIERQLFGQNGSDDPVGRIVTYLKRNDPDLAAGFASTVGAATTPRPEASSAQLATLLDRFERQAERLQHGSR